MAPDDTNHKITPEELQARYERLQKWQEDRLETYGWYAHYTIDPETGNADHHTHGLQDYHAHKDLQITLRVPMEVASPVFAQTIDLIKKGRMFKHGDICAEIIPGFDVKFVKVYRDGNPHLRIIIPDPKGNVEKEKMELAYAAQYL